jgi:hypothetical protein
MKVWIIKGDFGSWDSHRQKVLKVVDSEEKAILFKNEYESKPDILFAKELYYKWMNGGDEDEDGNIIPEMTPEEDEIWRKRFHELDDYCEFNNCIISEFDVE